MTSRPDQYGGTRIVTGTADWQGAFRSGAGTISTASRTLDHAPYTYASRFEGADGACPEEILAAGHAACFNHALANIAGIRQLTVESVKTTASVTMGRDDKGPAILAVHLVVEARAAGLTGEQFADLAEQARAGCAFTKALIPQVGMEASLAPGDTTTIGSGL
jgi:lipoyl-dependent peroxiredoxin